MQARRKKIDLYSVCFQSTLASRWVRGQIELAKHLEADDEREERLKQQKCKFCYYRSGLAGQAFTNWQCGLCDYEGQNANTDVPALCIVCAEAHGLCVKCGGDLEMKQRRKL